MKILKQVFKKARIRKIPICIFCYHKSGTALLSKVFSQFCQSRNWKFLSLMGRQTQIPQNADVILFGHSLIDPSEISASFVGLHVIRDPRDIIVSGYQYHCRTSEKWCINSDFTPKLPILFPKVPYSQQHRSEEWKLGYLKSLSERSYQENLLSMSQRDGLLFEMNNYGAWTIESMKAWNYNLDNILELKYEQLMNSYDNAFHSIFDHFGFSRSEIDAGMDVASKHDLRRKSAKELEKMNHVSSSKTSRWKEFFEPVHKEMFIKNFGNLLVELGYEKDNNW